MRALLGETFRLLAAHLNLFTLISLTVWLPGHVLRNYFEFFEPEDGAGQSLRAMLAIQVVFDPLVVAGTLVALGRIKSGLPVGYAVAMTQGLAAWGRLLVVRFVVNVAVTLLALGALFAASARGVPAVAMWTLLIGLAVVTGILLVRFAVADSVVVLEGANAITVSLPLAGMSEEVVVRTNATDVAGNAFTTELSAQEIGRASCRERVWIPV